MSWESQLAPTASIPMRGKPISRRSSTTQKLTESRISGSAGRCANTYSREGLIPPDRSTGIGLLSLAVRCPPLRAVHIAREPGPHFVKVDPEFRRVVMRAGFTLGGGLLPPTAHPCFELRADRDPQPCVQPGDLADRIGLHGAKVDVVEPIFCTVGAELQRPLHAPRPMFDVEPADVVSVDLGAE